MEEKEKGEEMKKEQISKDKEIIINKFCESIINKEIECQSNFCKKMLHKEIYLGSVNNEVFLFCSKKCRKEQLSYSRIFLGEFIYSVYGDK